MKKQVFLVLISALFSSIVIGQEKKETIKGADKDTNGCIVSAGYTYSKLKKNCIRVFEQKIKLNEVDPTKSYTSIVAVIFSQDKKNVELFIADEKESVILKRTGNKGNYIWKNSTYALSVSDKYVLKKGNKIIYKS